MRLEERQRETVQTERHAARMSLVAILGSQIPDRAEMISMAIEAHASGRLLFGTQWDQQLKLQRLFQLAHRGQPAALSEKWVACRRDPIFET